MVDAERFFFIREEILKWFKKNRVDYFFRQERTPYKVWISEVILQQTRLAAAQEKIFNFLKRFPDIDSLANASEQEVLDAFKGLGYYNRAKQLHKGAAWLVENKNFFNGEYNKLLSVPSIGPYTAGAISSICFSLPIPVIDGNIKRILSRLFLISGFANEKNFENKIIELTGYFFKNSNSKPGDINEGLMEFGQKICRPKSPDCVNCFIKNLCKAFQLEIVKNYPNVKKKVYKNVSWKVFFFKKKNKVAMQKYTQFPFLKNQMGFPSIIDFVEEEKTYYSAEFLISLKNQNNHQFVQGPKHSITDHKIKFYYSSIPDSNIEEFKNDFIYVNIQDVENLIISSGILKIWKYAF
jgi:A/G-specific adenine glycosylase